MSPKTATAAPAADETKHVGRGALYLSLTKLYFIVGSYGILFGIPWAVGGGSEEADAAANRVLGNFKAVNAFLSVISTVLIMGTTQAISRFVGRDPTRARVVKRTGVRIQLVLGAAIAGAYFLAAPLLVNNDPELVAAMRISAAIPLIYSIYSVMTGTLNGQRRFGEQALLDAGFTTLKVALVVGTVFIVARTGALSFLTPTEGAFAGFASAALLVFIGSMIITNRGHGSLGTDAAGAPSPREILAFQAQTVCWMFFIQWIVQMDIWYIQWFPGLDETAGEAARAVYGASQSFAQVSYSGVIALTFVLFPLISNPALKDDPGKARSYISEALRYALIIVVMVATTLSAVPARTLALLVKGMENLDPSSFEALRWLGLGYVAFALFFILCCVLNAFGNARASVVITIGVGLIQAGLGRVLMGFGLQGQAIATAIAMTFGLVSVVIFLQKQVGAILPTPTIVRTAIAGGIVYALGLVWHPEGKLITLGRFCASGMLFLVVIVALREFKRSDLNKFAKVIPGGRK